MSVFSDAYQRAVSLPILQPLRLARFAASNDDPSRRPTLVEAGIWIGGIPSRRCWRELREAGATIAVCLLREGPPPGWTASVEQLLWLPVTDNEAPNRDQLAAGCRFLDAARQEGRTVFVFCGAGMGRAPTLYLAWRTKRAGETLDAAIERLRTARAVLRLTARQLAALRAWSTEPRGSARSPNPAPP